MEITKDYFCDDESKIIFEARNNFYKSGDWKYILRMICELQAKKLEQIRDVDICSSFIKQIHNMTKNHPKSNIYIYGGGIKGKQVYEILKNNNIKIKAFIDKKIIGKCRGLEVVKLSDIIEVNNNIIIVPKGKYYDNMRKELLNMNVSEENIVDIDTSKEADLLEIKYCYRDDLKDVIFDSKNTFSIYGTQHWQLLVYTLLKNSGIDIKYIIKHDDIEDTDKFQGMDIISFEEFKRNKDYNDFIIRMNNCNSDELDEYYEENSNKVISLFNKDELQYFYEDFIPNKKETNHIFVDGGSLDLGTTAIFLDWIKGDCEKVYAFEVDNSAIEMCNRRLEENENLKNTVKLYKKGLWSRDCVLNLNETEMTGASFLEKDDEKKDTLHELKCINEIKIDCTSLDKVLNGDKVTFIKMDIEGSEIEALRGAEKSIQKYKPILAISIYHKYEDIQEIPSYIYSICPQYKFYLRQYHSDHTETVFYAIP